MEQDTYLTLEAPATAALRERSSKFLSFAWPVHDEEQIRQHIEALRKEYYDATHHCYAWRLGPQGERFRASDDGEPSGTAGRPILGQMLARGVTECLVVVVRYFGGTKLGVPGLIAAYKESAAAVLDAARIVERTVDHRLEIEFSYLAMNDVMRVVKEEQSRIEGQEFDNLCRMRVAVRASVLEALARKLEKIEGVRVERTGASE